MIKPRVHKQITVRHAIEYAWPIYKNNIGLMTAILGTMFGAWVLLEVLVIAGQPLGIVFWALIHLGFFFVFGGLQAGFVQICLKIYKGEALAYRDLFTHMRLGTQFFTGQLVYLLIVVGGIILLVVPGIIWGTRYGLIFFPLSNPVKNLRGSFEESVQLNAIVGSSFIGFWLAQVLFNILGFSLLGIGLFVTAPLSALMMTWAYQQLREG